MNTNQATPQLLCGLLKSHGIEHVVISPGSRNAPLILAMEHYGFQKYLAIDERSGGFLALGMAKRSQKTICLLCTSGTALVNYYPAITEAFYSQVPLLVISADRPPEWIDQMDGQTIRQNNIFGQHVKFSFQLPCEPSLNEEFRYSERIINQACHILSQKNDAGPGHINVPLREPLYEISEKKDRAVNIIRKAEPFATLTTEEKISYINKWNKHQKILVVLGEWHGTEKERIKIQKCLFRLSNCGAVIFCDHLFNGSDPAFLYDGDSLATLALQDPERFQPDLLIYAAGAIVSKKLKIFLRNNPATQHWRIHPEEKIVDLFQQLTEVIPLTIIDFIEQIEEKLISRKTTYQEHFLILFEKIRCFQKNFFTRVKFSDFSVFSLLMENLPRQGDFHFSNSSPVRYIQFFAKYPENYFFANRGVSGIDGCSSTAVGATAISGQESILITGDLSFFYDINGLFYPELSQKLKIILINNAGGGIFRLLPETQGFPVLEPWIEAGNTPRTGESVSKDAGFQYSQVNNFNMLKKELVRFLEAEGPFILEVFTPKEENNRVFRQYFAEIVKI